MLLSCCVAMWCCCCSRRTTELCSHCNAEMQSVPQLLDNPHNFYAVLEHHLMNRQQKMLDTIGIAPTDQIYQTTPATVHSNIQRPKCLMNIDYY
ncbi:hypothetical protein B566_EDAN007359 [Ephemera danica]|nr:hypothetical protein B566_EDAN007359 [Ephemera danica]